MKKNRMERTILELFEQNSDKIQEILINLYEKTHIIGKEDDDYEWCMVITSKGKLKIYEQLKFLYELKGRSQIIDYEYEILGQEYVNILDTFNYSKAIISWLEERGVGRQFISWYNNRTSDSSKKIEDPKALRFIKAEELLCLLKQWNEYIYNEVENNIITLNKEEYMLNWLDEKMAIIESTINCLRKGFKNTI